MARSGNDILAESITHLDFEQAMSDFGAMFPEMDTDIIETILRANQGVVDATIDQLLLIASDSGIEKKATSSQDLLMTTHPYKYSDHHIRGTTDRNPESNCIPSNEKILPIPMCSLRKWNPTLLKSLPADFLYLERYCVPYHGDSTSHGNLLWQNSLKETKSHRSNVVDQESQQQIDDERLAVLLQSAGFIQTLRNNQDFMESLDFEQKSKQLLLLESHDLEPKQVEDDVAFIEQLKKMGKVSRRKFTQLARIFVRGEGLSLMFKSSTRDPPILCDLDEDRTHTERSEQ